jgi:anaerobic magnesium-protoporphyrin IX monomethyl ester cyclase
MNIVINTTPIRPIPTDYPPFGSLAVIQSLRLAGYDPYFYDIDGYRPDFDEVVAFFEHRKPDIVGISAVVSTAYEYTKKLALAIRRVSPDTILVVGGNLAASAEILHLLCGIDICVIGEGEQTIVDLVRCLEKNDLDLVESDLREIKGISFLGKDNQMMFTGYPSAIPATDLLDPDWSILEQYSNISNFITEPTSRGDFLQDPRTSEPHRKGKKMATVTTTKGCVARCTFCHRWDKGFRAIPPEKVIARMRYLMDRYNVGFFQFGDEDFGADRRKTEELVERIKELDVLYQVAGVRVRSVDLDLLCRMKASGCVAIYYGMETGSPTMLQVMEKNASLDANIQAAKLTHEAKLFTIYQFVLAMPGETNQTIDETIDFARRVTEFLPEPPAYKLSVNYIQALPGTPVYEYARNQGLIGKTLEDEEQYLLTISDTNAADDTKFINFTDYDYLTVQTWRLYLMLETGTHYYLLHSGGRRPGWSKLARLFAESWNSAFRGGLHKKQRAAVGSYEAGGYFNLSATPYYELLYIRLYEVRHLLVWGFILLREFRRLPLFEFIRRLKECVVARLTRSRLAQPTQSLRKTMKRLMPEPASETESAMRPLRDGR